jgi:hypothetical protein
MANMKDNYEKLVILKKLVDFISKNHIFERFILLSMLMQLMVLSFLLRLLFLELLHF